jgi:hypothetical protein
MKRSPFFQENRQMLASCATTGQATMKPFCEFKFTGPFAEWDWGFCCALGS